jgi:hypothetical protein
VLLKGNGDSHGSKKKGHHSFVNCVMQCNPKNPESADSRLGRNRRSLPLNHSTPQSFHSNNYLLSQIIVGIGFAYFSFLKQGGALSAKGKTAAHLGQLF